MKNSFSMMLSFAFLFLLFACNSADEMPTIEPEIDPEMENTNLAAITNVSFTQNGDTYNFSVEITSPDEGCNQYADWWEVVNLDGDLIYRRVLGHSHVNEQPFTRSGGPVRVTETQEVWVRVHMNNTGYSMQGYQGSIANGFQASEIEEGFASDLASVEPLPDGCAF
ncbi:MAG: hypothetical protein AB8G22_28520 [Saprospiraceae bacterium]